MRHLDGDDAFGGGKRRDFLITIDSDHLPDDPVVIAVLNRLPRLPLGRRGVAGSAGWLMGLAWSRKASADGCERDDRDQRSAVDSIHRGFSLLISRSCAVPCVSGQASQLRNRSANGASMGSFVGRHWEVKKEQWRAECPLLQAWGLHPNSPPTPGRVYGALAGLLWLNGQSAGPLVRRSARVLAITTSRLGPVRYAWWTVVSPSGRAERVLRLPSDAPHVYVGGDVPDDAREPIVPPKDIDELVDHEDRPETGHDRANERQQREDRVAEDTVRVHDVRRPQNHAHRHGVIPEPARAPHRHHEQRAHRTEDDVAHRGRFLSA